MATNISYASGDTILETLVLHTLPDFGEHGDGIINSNLLLAYMKDKKRFKVLDGGLELWKGVLKSENSNAKWQGAGDTMSAQLQDPNERLRWDIKIFTDSIVINKLDEARNKGRAMIKNFAQTLRDQAESTIPNNFNSAFWAATPGTNEPNSIPSLISTTPTTGSIGGLSRVGRKELQNGVSTATIADIGAEAGLSALFKQIVSRTVGKDGPDLVIMTDTLWAGLAAYLNTLARYGANERMAQLDFDTIKYGRATIGYENVTGLKTSANSISSGYIYGLNSNHLAFECLKDGNFTWNPDGFERVGQTLNKALYFWVFCNLTTNLPWSHFVMTNVSTT